MEQRALERFAGAAVIITGGAHGIGRACAARLAEEGAHVVYRHVQDLRDQWKTSPLGALTCPTGGS